MANTTQINNNQNNQQQAPTTKKKKNKINLKDYAGQDIDSLFPFIREHFDQRVVKRSPLDPNANQFMPKKFPAEYQASHGAYQHQPCWGWMGYFNNSSRRAKLKGKPQKIKKVIDKDSNYPYIQGRLKMFGAHRYSWITYNNGGVMPLNTSFIVAHLCGNSMCVNPNHLVMSTIRDNIKHRLAHNGKYRTSSISRDKLTEKQVVEIRELYATGNFTQQELAEEYGVSRRNVSDIIRFKSWEDVGGPKLKDERKYKKYGMMGVSVTNSLRVPKDIIAIRQLYDSGITLKNIARLFDLSPGFIGQICRREAYESIP